MLRTETPLNCNAAMYGALIMSGHQRRHSTYSTQTLLRILRMLLVGVRSNTLHTEYQTIGSERRRRGKLIDEMDGWMDG